MAEVLVNREEKKKSKKKGGKKLKSTNKMNEFLY